ncbi:hypothetical protein BDY24DRAFT_440389 [Mrakia frigida]|uniref:uncharacterized protein n=1 Tax=Mrakia frigida TaxID=29902 RepID=UPI003FCC1A93
MPDFSSFVFSSSFSSPSPPSTKRLKTSREPVTSPLESEGSVLTVPLEVLERILSYTFLRRSPLTPSSDPYPLRNTTYLLVVSKAFHELCLPFFFHSITIGRPSDYVAFFDPKEGIFVVGNKGRKRWSFVRELCFGPMVEPRAVFPEDEGKPWSSWIVPLVVPSEDHLQTVCFLDTETDPLRTNPPHLSAIRDAVRDAALNREMENALRISHAESTSLLDFEDWVRIEFKSLEAAKRNGLVRYAQESITRSTDPFYHRLLRFDGRWSKPLLFTLSNRIPGLRHLCTMLISTGPQHLSADLNIYNHPQPTASSQSASSPPVVKDPKVLFAVARILGHLCVRTITLVGFSAEDRPYFLDRFHKAQRGKRRRLFCEDTAREGTVVFLGETYLKHLRRSSPGLKPLSEELQLVWKGQKPAKAVAGGRSTTTT